jgi:hypothetical protein
LVYTDFRWWVSGPNACKQIGVTEPLYITLSKK